MAVREILQMGDPRLLRVAQAVTAFDTDELHLLITDLLDTMRAAEGAGLAAPQIGVDWQLVIFGTDRVNPRYPQAPVVPRTVLINPVITPLGSAEVEDWEGCLSVPGLRGKVPRFDHIRYSGFDQYGDHHRAHGGRLSCPRGAARMRPPGGQAVPDAGARLHAIRLHVGAVS